MKDKDMDFNDFANRVRGSGVCLWVLDKRSVSNYWRGESPFILLDGRKPFGQKEKNPSPEDVSPESWYIVKDWHSGGVGGGSCWDNGEEDRHYPVSGDDEPEFVDLDKILEDVCPEITMLQYKKMMRALKIEEYDYSINEYYGNRSDHKVRAINIKELYDKITEG